MYYHLNAASISLDESFLTSKFSKILNSCNRSQKLLISICTVKEGTLLYSNTAFRKFLEYENSSFLGKNWKHGSVVIDANEVEEVQNKLTHFFSSKRNQQLISLKYHITNSSGKRFFLKHEAEVFCIEGERLVLNYYYDISEKEAIAKSIQMNTNFKFVKNDPISSREKEVLKLIADGYSSKEIAAHLFISNHTAISHRKHLIKKFQVKNTAQLIKEASKVIEL